MGRQIPLWDRSRLAPRRRDVSLRRVYAWSSAQLIQILKSASRRRCRVSSGSGAGSELQKIWIVFSRGVHDHAAILAILEMLFDRGFQRRVQRFFEVVGKFLDDALAIHEFSPCRK